MKQAGNFIFHILFLEFYNSKKSTFVYIFRWINNILTLVEWDDTVINEGVCTVLVWPRDLGMPRPDWFVNGTYKIHHFSILKNTFFFFFIIVVRSVKMRCNFL